MRAAHNRADDAVDSGFHAIDRQLKTAGEIIATMPNGLPEQPTALAPSAIMPSPPTATR